MDDKKEPVDVVLEVQNGVIDAMAIFNRVDNAIAEELNKDGQTCTR